VTVAFSDIVSLIDSGNNTVIGEKALKISFNPNNDEIYVTNNVNNPIILRADTYSSRP
jgi:DNA-binding beta-propeller fold protein YncE